MCLKNDDLNDPILNPIPNNYFSSTDPTNSANCCANDSDISEKCK